MCVYHIISKLYMYIKYFIYGPSQFLFASVQPGKPKVWPPVLYVIDCRGHLKIKNVFVTVAAETFVKGCP